MIAFRKRCAYCGQPLPQRRDHVLALALRAFASAKGFTADDLTGRRRRFAGLRREFVKLALADPAGYSAAEVGRAIGRDRTTVQWYAGERGTL